MCLCVCVCEIDKRDELDEGMEGEKCEYSMYRLPPFYGSELLYAFEIAEPE